MEVFKKTSNNGVIDEVSLQSGQSLSSEENYRRQGKTMIILRFRC